MTPTKGPCKHLTAIESLRPAKAYVCESCVKIGSRWMHLRTCQTCGITLCCDSSPNKHASGHARDSGHPVVCSAEPGERWLWCYVDEEFAEY
jgi:hypothetical protein